MKLLRSSKNGDSNQFLFRLLQFSHSEDLFIAPLVMSDERENIDRCFNYTSFLSFLLFYLLFFFPPNENEKLTHLFFNHLQNII